MDIFKRVDGRYVISGGLIRVESVEVNHRGDVRRETLLSNGDTVRVVDRGSNYLGIFTGKGARSVRVVGETVVNFYIDGVLVATVGADDVAKFTVV